MIIGVPKEIKESEGRVALTPKGAGVLVKNGHKVLVEKNAGKEADFLDKDYKKAGAKILKSPVLIYKNSDMIVKVKEPLPQEYRLLKPEQIIFTFLHLAASYKLVQVLKKSGVTALAYETVEKKGELPLLAPMSKIAGEIAIDIGAQYLRKEYGGKGLLFQDAKVVILGSSGTVGEAALKKAKKIGAYIIGIDLAHKLPKRSFSQVKFISSSPRNILKAIKEADLVIGAAAASGKKTPRLITKKMVHSMQKKSIIVDVAIDQGGCAETSHPTSHQNPVFIKYEVIHYCVANMPGAVPKSSALALTKATFPYVLEIANKGFKRAVKENPALAKGVNIYRTKITHPKLAEVFREKYTLLENLL